MSAIEDPNGQSAQLVENSVVDDMSVDPSSDPSVSFDEIPQNSIDSSNQMAIATTNSSVNYPPISTNSTIDEAMLGLLPVQLFSAARMWPSNTTTTTSTTTSTSAAYRIQR